MQLVEKYGGGGQVKICLNQRHFKAKCQGKFKFCSLKIEAKLLGTDETLLDLPIFSTEQEI